MNYFIHRKLRLLLLYIRSWLVVQLYSTLFLSFKTYVVRYIRLFLQGITTIYILYSLWIVARFLCVNYLGNIFPPSFIYAAFFWES